MASIINLRISAEQLGLSHVLEEGPEFSLEVDRSVRTNTDSVWPFIWVDADDFEAFEQALDADRSVESYDVTVDFDEETLYRMEWSTDIEHVLDVIGIEGSVLRSVTTNTHSKAWNLQIMCSEHERLSDVHDACTETKLSCTVGSIYQLESNEGPPGLTTLQHESLTAAKEKGFYDVPRGVSLKELADELGVSHQALSERLRRGHRNLVNTTVLSTENSYHDGKGRAGK